MTEHRLKPPAVHILFNPGADTFTGGKIKRSLDCAERLDRPVLIAAPIRHFRIIYSNSRHDLLPIAKFDPPPAAHAPENGQTWAPKPAHRTLARHSRSHQPAPSQVPEVRSASSAARLPMTASSLRSARPALRRPH